MNRVYVPLNWHKCSSVHSLQVTNLEKSIAEMEIEMKNDQNNWLRLQANILDMSEKLNRQMNESHLAQQRKIHISFD